MSRLEMFLRELKLTPKQAKRRRQNNNTISVIETDEERREREEDVRAVEDLMDLDQSRRMIVARRQVARRQAIQEAIQEARQEADDERAAEAAEALIELEAQQLLDNEIAAEAQQLLDNEIAAEADQLQANPINLKEAREVIQTEKGAEREIKKKAFKQARKQNRIQNREQNKIINMDIGQISPIVDDNGDIVTTQVEIDLGCNEVEDQDEDDENQDNEICNIRPRVQEEGQPQITPGVFTVGDFNNAKSGTFTQQDNSVIGGQNVVGTLSQRINNLLIREIRRIGSRRAQRTTQTQTIQSRIFDIVHESYSEGKLQAEVKNTSFKDQNSRQDDVIAIYKTDNNLIKRIKNTFNEYVYTYDDTPITLDDTDILIVLFYGVEKNIKGQTKRYKVEYPKPKLKRAVVGGDNTDKIDKTIRCYTDGTRPGCSFFNDLTTLYAYFNTAVNKDDLIKSVILWFDTHHDFKEDRYTEAKTVWNAAFGETFITWYAKKFFTPVYNPLNPNQQYSFSIEATDNRNVLTPVVNFINTTYPVITDPNRTRIPTLLYKISQTYLQNRLFEKTVLLHYIVHNFAVPTDNSTELLRDILYVHTNTYNELLTGIRDQAEEINNDTTINDPQKLKKLKGVALKLKPLIKLYGAQTDPTALNTALANALIDNQSVDNTINVLNNNNALNRINDINAINAIIHILLNYVPTFTFVDTNNPLPTFTSSNNIRYVVDVNKRNKLLETKDLQYVPSALFDSNGGNTYEPGSIIRSGGTPQQPNYRPDTHYDTFVDTVNSYTTGVNHLGNIYNYRRNGCNLEVTQNNPRNNQDNIVLTKADIRCSQTIAREIPDDAKNTLYLKRYLTQQLSPIVPDDKFIVRMKEVLLKFVGDGNQFAIQKNRNGYSLTLPTYFNNIKSGPGVQDLVFLTILYRLEGQDNLQLVDNIVNLKRVGDYGQVIDAKMANLPFFTTDNMETLMCIIEKVSCYIDFNQGVIIYDNGRVDANGRVIGPDFIRSKSKTRDRLDPPGYGRR